MRREDPEPQELFLYGSLEERTPADHPPRPIRAMVDRVLAALDDTIDELYGRVDGRRLRRNGCCGRNC